jgi:uncharacterized protein (TIGR00369 family)
MKKIKNPYDKETNMCFGCSQNNTSGLKLQFEEDDMFVCATWQPTSDYQGYVNILHGGIISTLMDEVGAWCINLKLGTAGVTSEMKIKYLSPVFINKGSLTVKASLHERKEKTAVIKCLLYNDANKLCAQAEIEYFIYPQEIAIRKFRYPGRDAFYMKE